MKGVIKQLAIQRRTATRLSASGDDHFIAQPIMHPHVVSVLPPFAECDIPEIEHWSGWERTSNTSDAVPDPNGRDRLLTLDEGQDRMTTAGNGQPELTRSLQAFVARASTYLCVKYARSIR